MRYLVTVENSERYRIATPLKQQPKEIMSLIMLAIIGMIVGYGILAVSVFAFTAFDPSAAAAVGAMLGGLIGHISVLVFLIALVHHLFF